ncbi:MAG TPA: ATP-grasp domain-containing protein [Nitrospirota bacterium]
MDVLLTDASSRICYSALRSLASLGLKVAVADTSRTGMSQWSRLASATYTYSSPFSDEEAFIRDINQILRETGAKFLLPAYGEAEILSKYRKRLPHDVTLPVASYESLQIGNDKELMWQFAKDLDVPVPDKFEWASLEELEAKVRGYGDEVVIKLRRGHAAKGVFYASDAEGAVALCRRLINEYQLKPERYPIVQKKIQGNKWTVSCVYHEGRLLDIFTQRMLREKPLSGGASTYRISVRNKDMEDYATRILDGLKFNGIAMVEFKYHEEADQVWFIELNPRLWGAISHSVAAGADFVKTLYVACTKGYDEAWKMVQQYRLGMYSRWLMGDVMIAAAEIKKLRVKGALKALMPMKSDDYDDFKMDDPGAFAGEIGYFFTKAVKSRAARKDSSVG